MMLKAIRFGVENEGKSYRNRVDDGESHHSWLSESQEAVNVVLILHVEKYFGHLDTDLKNQTKKNIKTDVRNSFKNPQ